MVFPKVLKLNLYPLSIFRISIIHSSENKIMKKPRVRD